GIPPVRPRGPPFGSSGGGRHLEGKFSAPVVNRQFGSVRQFSRNDHPTERILQVRLDIPVDGTRSVLRIERLFGDGARGRRRDFRLYTALQEPLGEIPEAQLRD